MDSKYTALFIDTVSIQEYIFFSNKLKENIGASYLVDRIYDEPLRQALNEVFETTDVDLSGWEKEPDKPLFADGGEFDVGYVGGGNALIFLKQKDEVKKLIGAISKNLLASCPGLRTSYGIIDDFNVDQFHDSFGRIAKSASVNKNESFPVVVLPKYGINSDCPLSGESAEVAFSDPKGNFISSVSYSKLEASLHATKRLHKMVGGVLGNEFKFTDEIDKLGQTQGRNYAAIVHIDGNRMGERFQSCKNLQEFRRLSKSVREATAKAFEILIADVVGKIRGKVISETNGFEFHRDEGRIILPIRPIVIGGDDITFVCDGRLAVYLTEKFMNAFSEQTASSGGPLSACGGIAIVKTKYPFYKAYTLAEELTGRAKRKSRSKQNSSFVDFYISSGGFTGNVDEILERHANGEEGNLHFGPYRVDKTDEEDSLAYLKKRVSDFREWPTTKINEFREILFGSSASAKSFIREEESKGHRLPEAGTNTYHSEIWLNGRTPFHDAIELFDFYPKELNKELAEGQL
jgi:hypothetical protein